MQARVATTLLPGILMPLLAAAETQRFAVIVGGKNVGHLIADTQGEDTHIDSAGDTEAGPVGFPRRLDDQRHDHLRQQGVRAPRAQGAEPVRIRNVRLHDPKAGGLTAPVSVLVAGREISAVESLDSKALKTISMVVKYGNFYYPPEIHPKFGIKPFTTIPVTKRDR